MQNVKMVKFSAKRHVFKTKFTFFASFLIFTVANGSASPNGPSFESDSRLAWLPNDSEDEIAFRSLSSDQESFYDDPSELEDEHNNQMTMALDNVLKNEKEIPEGLLMAMSKRNPSSADNRMYKNRLGYHLVEGSGHQIMGTSSVATCNKYGVFFAGKVNAAPFIRSNASGWYLAIDDSGNVYMTPNKSTDTAIRSVFYDGSTDVVLYRKVSSPTQTRYFLHITLTGSKTVKEEDLGPSSIFKVRIGSTCS